MYDYFKEHPALKKIELPELRRRLELSAGEEAAPYFDDLLAILKQKGQVLVESNTAALPGRELKLEGALAAQAQQVEKAILGGGMAPPQMAELEAQLRIQPKLFKEIKRYLIDTGRIVEAAPDIHFHVDHYEKAKTETVKLFAGKPELTASEIRQHLNMNRKYVIPLVELFDKRGVTVRVGDKRKLKS